MFVHAEVVGCTELFLVLLQACIHRENSNLLLLASFPHFVKKKRLVRSPRCLRSAPSFFFLNGWTDLYGTIYYGARTHLNGVLHKYFPSVCVSDVYPHIVAKQRRGKIVAAARIHTQQKKYCTRHLLRCPCLIREKEKQAISSQNFLFILNVGFNDNF
jgi:hypothetical protein